MTNKPLIVSEATHKRTHEASKNFKIPAKRYTEEALNFFNSRGLNPVDFKISEAIELSSMMRKGFDRIISFIKTQEQTILKRIAEELLISRKLSEAQINLLIDLLADEGSAPDLHKAVEGYVNIKEPKSEEALDIKVKSTTA